MRLTLQILTGIVAGIVVILLLAAWRLSAGPVRVDFLTPYLEQALDNPARGLRVDIGEMVVRWAGWARNVDLQAREIRVLGADGATVAVLPTLSIELSLRALLHGQVAPTFVEVVGAEANLVRNQKGRFEFDIGPEAADEQGTSRLMLVMLDTLSTDAKSTDALRFLQAVRLADCRVTVHDHALGRSWVVDPAHLELRRDPAGLLVTFGLTIALGAQPAKVGGTALYDRTKQLVDISTSFAGVDTEAVASTVPRLRHLSSLRSVLHGELSVSISVDGSVEHATFDIVGGAGEVSFPDRMVEALPIRELTLRGRFDGSSQHLDLELASLVFGSADRSGPTVSISGTASDLDAQPNAKAQARVTSIPVDDLGLYWPRGLGSSARDWVTRNIKAGTVTEATMDIAFTVPGDDAESIAFTHLAGTVRYEHLDVYYQTAMPPVAGVSGSGIFDTSSLRFTVTSGALDHLQLERSTVDLLEFNTDGKYIVIDAAASGPLQSALELPAAAGINVADSFSVDETDTGQATIRANLRFPLTRDVSFAEATVSLNAEVSGLVMDSELIDGPISVTGSYTKQPGDAGALNAVVRLQAARISFPFLRWEKPPGTEGVARLDLELMGQRPVNVNTLELEAGTLRTRGSASFDRTDGELSSLSLEELVMPGTVLTQIRVNRGSDGIAVHLGGGSLNAAPFLGGGGESSGSPSPLSFSLSAPALEQVSFGPERFLTNVELRLERHANGWSTIIVNGDLPPALRSSADADPAASDCQAPSTRLQLTFVPLDPERYQLRVATGDVGAVLRLLSAVGRVQGGCLMVSGEATAPFPHGVLRAHLEGADYRVLGAPLLGRLLTVASLRGIAHLFRQNGLWFEQLTGDITLEDGVVRTDLIRAYGSGIGLTTRGSLDLGSETLDLEGTLVPAYSANRILGSIPWVGGLLTGDQGEGVLAVTYTAKGNVKDPEIKTHALSNLTPSFLRGLFGASDRPESSDVDLRAVPE